MKQKLNNFLMSEGYFYAATSLPEFSVFFLPTNTSVEVVMIVDYQKEIYLSEEVYTGIREKFIQSFQEKGFSNVHMIALVLCKDVSQVHHIFYKDLFSWYINVEEKDLFVPDNHMEDFYGLKGKINAFLLNSDAYIQTENTNSVKLSLVERVKRNWKKLPYVNVVIVLLNVLIFILCAFSQDVLYNKGAFSFLLIEDTKQYYRFITSAFLHANINHLFNNMLVLYFLGNTVEEKIGHFQYAILYFLSAIVGNIASAFYEVYVGQFIFSVGASGAVFGIVGAVLMLVLLQGGKWENITLPRILIMVLYSLYSGFTAENINNVAHIGGFITGLLIMGTFSIMNMFLKKKEAFHEN